MPRLGYLDRPYLILDVDAKLMLHDFVFIKQYLINYISLFCQSKIFSFSFLTKSYFWLGSVDSEGTMDFNYDQQGLFW